MTQTTAFTTSSETDKVIPAFVKALSAMNDIQRTESVNAGPMKYKFAPLDKVLDAARPALRDNGLAMSQTPSTAEGVTTTIFHESGQWMTFEPLLIHPAGGTPQNVGSAITYARRYAILSILGLATEDDDGAAGSVAATPPPSETETNPLAERVDAALHRMTMLDEPRKVRMKEWAAAENHKLTARAIFENSEWLGQVESWLDINEDDEPADEEPE